MSKQTTGPVFVVGAPRTGTTLTMEILNRHPDIHLYDEVHYNERVVDTVGSQDVLDENQLIQSIDILIEHSKWNIELEDKEKAKAILLEKLSEKNPAHPQILSTFLETEAESFGKSIWGDSSPQDVLYMRTLKKWYPDARFIGVVRDPRAFLSSYKNYYRKKIGSYRNRYNPVTNSVLWRSYMNSLLDAKSGDLSDSLTLLHYEKLVTNPEEELKRVMEFLGLEFHPEMLDVGRQNSSYFSVKEDYKQSGINAGSLDRWREGLSNVELWFVEKICGQTMEKLGFAPEKTRLRFSDAPGLLQIGAQFPGRLYNILFKTKKPFTRKKLGKVFSALK